MKVLVACEYSGTVRDAFRRRGHDAISCDLLPTDVPGPHIQGDVRDVLGDGCWDIMVAHPPCTFMCQSGVRWLYERDGRWDQMREACEFFNALWNAPIPRIAIENPTMHPHAKALVGPPHHMVQPWEFGHGEVKGTCLWLKNLPPLMPTELVSGREARIHQMAPGADRWKARSTTFAGIAEAMADQWQVMEAA